MMDNDKEIARAFEFLFNKYGEERMINVIMNLSDFMRFRGVTPQPKMYEDLGIPMIHS